MSTQSYAWTPRGVKRPAAVTKAAVKRGKFMPRAPIYKSIASLEKSGVTYIRRKVFYDLQWDANIGYYDNINLTGSNFGFGLNFQGNQISINFGATPSSAQYWTSVGNGLDFDEISNLFEMFMIDRVDMEVTCGTMAQGNSSANATFKTGQNPTIFGLIDYENANAPANTSEMLQDADCKYVSSFDSQHPFRMSVKPKWQQICSLNSQVVGTQNTFNVRPARGWISTQQGNLTDHYGMKIHTDPRQNGVDDPVVTPTVSQTHRFIFTYHYRCKHTQ